MKFSELEKIDVTAHIEKKGKFSYLSWPFAVSAFRRECPYGVWRITQTNGLPYQTFDGGAFVHVTVYPDVTEQAICFEQWHPVLDNNNRPILKPSAFQVNTSIQRALVKAIAIATGIGLHIYAGEDLPPGNGDIVNDFISGEQLAAIQELITLAKADVPKLLQWAGADSTTSIPAGKRDALVKMLNDKIAKLNEPGADG